VTNDMRRRQVQFFAESSQAVGEGGNGGCGVVCLGSTEPRQVDCDDVVVFSERGKQRLEDLPPAPDPVDEQ
jgi:hypothetical protein